MKIRNVLSYFLVIIGICFSYGVSLAQTRGELPIYKNEALGITIIGPLGWFVAHSDEAQKIVSQAIGENRSVESVEEPSLKIGVLVTFSKFPLGTAAQANPTITLSSEALPQSYNIKTTLDYANINILLTRKMLKDFELIKEPKLVNLNGREGIVFMHEGTVIKGNREIRIRMLSYVFLKNDIAYSLNFADKPDTFSENLAIAQTALNSFILE